MWGCNYDINLSTSFTSSLLPQYEEPWCQQINNINIVGTIPYTTHNARGRHIHHRHQTLTAGAVVCNCDDIDLDRLACSG